MVVESAGLPEVLFLKKRLLKPLKLEKPSTDSISTLPEKAKSTPPSKASSKINLGKALTPGDTCSVLFSVRTKLSSFAEGVSFTGNTSTSTFPGNDCPSPSEAT